MTKTRRKKGRGKTKPGPYPFELRLRVVRMYLEEEYPVSMICQETGVGRSTISTWVKKYRLHGEEGLKPKQPFPPRQSTRINKTVAKKIVDLKKENPSYGSRRISDILKRFFFIKTSPTTVHKTLVEKELVEKKRTKPKRNPPKPRFFERSKPNQLWQSDICTFRLAGKNAYLIGFIDDYSRYITGLGLYRSQTAANVLETYRRAVGEYGVPKEMLTDNGRQYVNWRGTTTFQRELQKDRVKHIRSRPHHPMTLGKIERFWKTILQEFLLRAQFDSFEDAQQRIAIWINYYNHRRPHQGIKGLCPADRFFEIQSELKRTLAKGVEENALELALRGRPRDPFYMVGRMNGQNVVIRAEKGKLRMLVNESGEPTGEDKELIYTIDTKETDHDHEKTNTDAQEVQCGGKTQGGTDGMDGKAERYGDLQGDEAELDPAGPMAESGHGGYAECLGAEAEGRFPVAGRPSGETARKEARIAGTRLRETGRPLGITATETAACIELADNDTNCQTYGEEETTTAGYGEKTGGNHHEGPFGFYDGDRRSGPAGGVEEDLLQVGEPGVGGDVEGAGGETSGPPRNSGA